MRLYNFSSREDHEYAAPAAGRSLELNTKGARQGSTWRLTPVDLIATEDGQLLTPTDWPYLVSSMPAIKKSALPSVPHLLEPYVEFLELACAQVPLVALNVLVTADALDRDATEGPRFSDGRFMDFHKYVFHSSAVPDDGLFRLTDDLLGPVLFTEPLVKALGARTTGLSLQEVWRDD